MIAYSGRAGRLGRAAATAPEFERETPLERIARWVRRRDLRFAIASLVVAVAAALALFFNPAPGLAPPSPSLSPAHFFAGIAGAAAVTFALAAAALYRHLRQSRATAVALRSRLESDLALERVFLLRNGQLVPASPSTEAYLAATPRVPSLATSGRRLRARLGRATFAELAPLLKRLAENGEPFEHRAPDAEGRKLMFRGEPLGARAVVRFWPEDATTPSSAPVAKTVDVPPRSSPSASASDAATHAFDRAPIGIATFDAEGRLLASNAAAGRLWRLQDDQLHPGATVRSILDALRTVGRAPERADFADWRALAIRDPLRAFSANSIWSLPDGDALRVSAHRTPDGGFVCYIADETGPLGLERRFKAMQGVRQATIAAIDQGLAVIGPDGRAQLLNPAFLEMWRLDPTLDRACVAGSGPSIAALAESASETEADRKIWSRIRAAIGGAREGGGVARRADRFLHARGADRFYAIRATPLPDGASLIACDDVSDEHRVEAALRERNTALETADRVRTEFLGAVGTQLRTPLNSVIGFAELMRDGVAGQLTPDQHDYVTNILTPAHDLRNLISDALDLGALEAGAIEFRRDSVDLRRLVSSVAELLSQRASVNGARILADPPRQPVMIQGDEARLMQAAFGAGSAALANATPGDAVALVLVTDGVEAVIRISLISRGPRRAADETGEASWGSGNGEDGLSVALSLTQRIVELHGGVVEIEESGGAQAVAIRLPASNPQETAE